MRQPEPAPARTGDIERRGQWDDCARKRTTTQRERRDKSDGTERHPADAVVEQIARRCRAEVERRDKHERTADQAERKRRDVAPGSLEKGGFNRHSALN